MAKVPTGPRSFVDDVTGAIGRTIGGWGYPVNYDAGGQWRKIDTRWGALGSGRGVDRGVHGTRIGGDLQALTVKWDGRGDGRNVVIRPDRLIKFNIAAKTWATIATAVAPSSVTPFGARVFLHGIYPGVDRRLEYFNDSVSDGLVFRQSARDWLAALGGWAGHWLGSVSDLDIQITGHEWRSRKDDSVFRPDDRGRLFDDAFELRAGGRRVFALPRHDYLEGPTGSTWGLAGATSIDDLIPVRRFVVVRGGRLKLVELFDPARTVAIPRGDIAHNATFGNTIEEAASLSPHNAIRADTFTMGSVAGTADVVSMFYTDQGGDAGNKKKHAIYLTDGTLHGTTVEDDPGVNLTGFRDVAISGTVNLDASTNYQLCGWTNYITNIKVQFFFGQTTQTQSKTYDGNYPDPEAFTDQVFTHLMSIHCDYTEGVPGPPVGGLALMGVGR